MGVSFGNLKLNNAYSGYIMLGDQLVWPIFTEQSFLFLFAEKTKIDPISGSPRTSTSLYKIKKDTLEIISSNIDLFESFGLYSEWIKSVSYSNEYLYVIEYTSGSIYKISCSSLEIEDYIESDFRLEDLDAPLG